MVEMRLDELEKIVVAKTPIIVDEDGGMIYSLKNRQGPDTWENIRKMNYGKNPKTDVPFRQTTFPEATRIASFGIGKKIKGVVEAVNNYVLTGNTLVVWTPKEVYAVDIPEQEIVEQLGAGNKDYIEKIAQNLKSKLGSREENEVIFSNDNRIRQTKREGLVTGVLNSKSDLAKNRLVITLSGSLKNADLTSQIANNYAQNPAVYALSDEIKYAVRVPVLDAGGFDCGLLVDGGGPAGADDGCSFGGQEIAEGNALKNGGNK